SHSESYFCLFFFFQAEDGIRDFHVTGVQTCALPILSADGSMLFFSSNRRGGYGGNDIWYSRRMPDGNWSEVKNVGDVINTDKDEVSPFIYFNNEQLFFASDGHMGFGGKDLFMSKIVNGEFTKPVNLRSEEHTSELQSRENLV